MVRSINAIQMKRGFPLKMLRTSAGLGTTAGLSLPSRTFFSIQKQDTLGWKGCLWLHTMGAVGVSRLGFPSLERLLGRETPAGLG